MKTKICISNVAFVQKFFKASTTCYNLSISRWRGLIYHITVHLSMSSTGGGGGYPGKFWHLERLMVKIPNLEQFQMSKSRQWANWRMSKSRLCVLFLCLAIRHMRDDYQSETVASWGFRCSSDFTRVFFFLNSWFFHLRSYVLWLLCDSFAQRISVAISAIPTKKLPLFSFHTRASFEYIISKIWALVVWIKKNYILPCF